MGVILQNNPNLVIFTKRCITHYDDKYSNKSEYLNKYIARLLSGDYYINLNTSGVFVNPSVCYFGCKYSVSLRFDLFFFICSIRLYLKYLKKDHIKATRLLISLYSGFILKLDLEYKEAFYLIMELALTHYKADAQYEICDFIDLSKALFGRSRLEILDYLERSNVSEDCKNFIDIIMSTVAVHVCNMIIGFIRLCSYKDLYLLTGISEKIFLIIKKEEGISTIINIRDSIVNEIYGRIDCDSLIQDLILRYNAKIKDVMGVIHNSYVSTGTFSELKVLDIFEVLNKAIYENPFPNIGILSFVRKYIIRVLLEVSITHFSDTDVKNILINMPKYFNEWMYCYMNVDSRLYILYKEAQDKYIYT